MSEGKGYRPAGRPAKLTIDEFQQFGHVFKELLAESPAIKWSVYAAGVGGLLETLHIVWLAARWWFKF